MASRIKSLAMREVSLDAASPSDVNIGRNRPGQGTRALPFDIQIRWGGAGRGENKRLVAFGLPRYGTLTAGSAQVPHTNVTPLKSQGGHPIHRVGAACRAAVSSLRCTGRHSRAEGSFLMRIPLGCQALRPCRLPASRPTAVKRSFSPPPL